ncbi:MAG: MFS transporter [Gammaproteobacteria bacterium]|nr:MFS transporter [Gammaproteobacteria bacterium]
MKISTVRQLFGNRNFALFSVGNVLSLTGNWIQLVAVSWLIWELTNSTVWLGIVAASQFVPIFLVGPLGGVLADRLDRRWLILFSNGGGLFCALALFVIYTTGHLNVVIICIIRALQAAFQSLGQPARLAMVPRLVPSAQQTAAIAIGNISLHTARLLGPILSGVIVAVSGIGLAMLVNALSFMVFISCIAAIRLPDLERKAPRSPDRRAGAFSEAIEGMAFLGHNKAILMTVILAAVMVLFARPIMFMLPAYVDMVFVEGMAGLSILISMSAAGSILGGLSMARTRHSSGLMKVVLLSSLAIAAAAAAFALVREYWVAGAFLVVLGFMNVVFSVSSQSLVQHAVDEDTRGRVMSSWFMLNRGGPALGTFFFGIVADLIGLSWPIILGSGVVLITVLLCLLYRRRVLEKSNIRPAT